ncbi:sigma 54-interacting transcriptional regulator [Lampropedia aestuarii]|uniref:sigma 54-interacting transcriptional regulator n=1 Tax=Lampropedia aestuarii TaxID=2562762 RepID=UPI002469B843|nr:sigma 54-interacting transcriptional regulator [Lampropedia aestuarii]MDH5859250.1 sigma 54-interacting transcriptional regulator [Lampropedia aestuarii]
MRIEITGTGRPGLASDVLSILEKRKLPVRGVEVAAHRTYFDLPALELQSFFGLTDDLLALKGVSGVREIQLLPAECQRMQFEALLNALSDPLIAVDMSANVVSANDAAIRAFSINAERLLNRVGLSELLGVEAGACLEARLKSCSGGEAAILGKPYLVDVLPVVENYAGSTMDAHGAVFIFRSASSLGQRIYSIEKREISVDTGLIGKSEAMKNVKKLIERFSSVNAPLLITGETGTGKELVARACHRLSDRSEKPFLALNCAALPESLAESELFGYAAGAFSGAQRNGKPGLLELADGGTIFLDEIGEMSLYLQAKLLRFLQDGSFIRIGGKAETRVDIRVLAATHRDLPHMVSDRTFREDLYYRLNVLSIHIPPLREREEDIPELAVYFSRQAAVQVGTEFSGISSDAMDCLCSFRWPGNARQMENLIFRSITLADTAILDKYDLPDELRSPSKKSPPQEIHANPLLLAEHRSTGEIYAERIEQTEKQMLAELYMHFPSTRKLAAQLGLSHSAVAKKLQKFGIAKNS